MALAARCGLTALLVEALTLAGKGTANAAAKITALIAGMVAGADSISDMDLLCHGGMGRVFDGVRAPSTLGTFLRRFSFGHVRQLDAVAAGLLARLAAATPLLPGADQIVFVDIDDTVRQTYGYAKQGAGRGYTDPRHTGQNGRMVVSAEPVGDTGVELGKFAVEVEYGPGQTGNEQRGDVLAGDPRLLSGRGVGAGSRARLRCGPRGLAAGEAARRAPLADGRVGRELGDEHERAVASEVQGRLEFGTDGGEPGVSRLMARVRSVATSVRCAVLDTPHLLPLLTRQKLKAIPDVPRMPGRYEPPQGIKKVGNWLPRGIAVSTERCNSSSIVGGRAVFDPSCRGRPRPTPAVGQAPAIHGVAR